jgi:hypothetical protein
MFTISVDKCKQDFGRKTSMQETAWEQSYRFDRHDARRRLMAALCKHGFNWRVSQK